MLGKVNNGIGLANLLNYTVLNARVRTHIKMDFLHIGANP
jgi:hypothetical protein